MRWPAGKTLHCQKWVIVIVLQSYLSCDLYASYRQPIGRRLKVLHTMKELEFYIILFGEDLIDRSKNGIAHTSLHTPDHIFLGGESKAEKISKHSARFNIWL